MWYDTSFIPKAMSLEAFTVLKAHSYYSHRSSNPRHSVLA